jgi:hypothetical protein
MTNHPNRAGKFELVFVGGTIAQYRRWHRTFEVAQQTAVDELAKLREAHAHSLHKNYADQRAIIYGPGCGSSGYTVL